MLLSVASVVMLSRVTISASVVISAVVLGVVLKVDGFVVLGVVLVVVVDFVVVVFAQTCCKVHLCKAGSKCVSSGHSYRVFTYIPRIFEHKKYVLHV